MRSRFYRAMPYNRDMARRRRARMASFCLLLFVAICVLGSQLLRH